jgi:hypothetical protein
VVSFLFNDTFPSPDGIVGGDGEGGGDDAPEGFNDERLGKDVRLRFPVV